MVLLYHPEWGKTGTMAYLGTRESKTIPLSFLLYSDIGSHSNVFLENHRSSKLSDLQI